MKEETHNILTWQSHKSSLYNWRPVDHIRPTKLFVDLLLVITSSFIFFTPEDLKNLILILHAALLTGATRATDFKTLP
jgi:hypothetical protein